MARSKLPVTLITGYLGSGKTTLVNHLLSTANGMRLGVLVNEFGAVGIDGELIQAVAADNPVIELSNGCLCCVMTGEFEEALSKLRKSRHELDHIIIEMSGAADPTSVIKILWGSPELTAYYRLDGVVSVVDAAMFLKTRDELVKAQVSVADLVVISKASLVPPEQMARVRQEVATLNTWAEVIEADFRENCKFDPKQIFGLDAYRKSIFRPVLENAVASHGSLHSISASWDGTLTPSKLQSFFQQLLSSSGEKLLRIKALVHVEGEAQPWLIQGVQNWIERSKGPKHYSGANRLVILGKDLDVAQIESAIEVLKSRSPEAAL
jgi:G3E family GTPase